MAELLQKTIIIEHLEAELRKRTVELNRAETENFILKRRDYDVSLTERHLRDKILETEEKQKEIDALNRNHREDVAMYNHIIKEKDRKINSRDRELFHLKTYLNKLFKERP